MKRIVTVIGLILLTGCASVDKEVAWTQEQYYREARSELDSGRFTNAIKLYDALQARYPYGVYADQANLDAAYAQFRLNDRVQAVAECDRFIQRHPAHPNVDYAYYLKGRAQELAFTGPLAALARQDVTERDPDAARNAFIAYRDLVNRFPDSRYAADSRARMERLVDVMAQMEMHAARYYLRRGAALAAVNRAKAVIERFPLSSSREEALALMVAGYDKLGDTTLRDDARRVLQLNFPSSQWLETPYKGERPSWLAWLGK